MAMTSFKIVLITGASSGMGAEIARSFAKQGAALSLTGRNKDSLCKVAQECKDLGAKNVLEIIADLSKYDGIKQIVKETFDVYDKLNVLVNCAGLMFFENTECTKFESFNAIFEVNLRAPFFLSQMCIPFLEKAKGNIVNISSMTSQMCLPDFTAYNVTKAGLDHFTKTAALELSAKGIRVNAVNPGVVRTNELLHMKFEDLDQLYAHQASLQPLDKRLVQVHEIADAVLFLSSDAAKMITGVCLNVDGGRALTGQ